MHDFSFILMMAWSLAALAWWGIALRLARRAVDASNADAINAAHPVDPDCDPDSDSEAEIGIEGTAPDRADPPLLSIFKPLPGARGRPPVPGLIRGLQSFVDQLDAGTELLIGVDRADFNLWEPWISRWSRACGPDRLRIVCRETPSRLANPKIAWEQCLAEVARGEWWMWSDADMAVPDGFLARARIEFAASGARMLTYGYVVRAPEQSRDLLDALFINVEFFPGVQLLSLLDRLHLAFGACMVFRRDDFFETVRWEQLGEQLAEDHFLGRNLGPAKLGSAVLETVPHSDGAAEALFHYLRWQKTIRWRQPAGFAAQLAVTPLPGWIVWALAAPDRPERWAAVGLWTLLEAGWGRAHCRIAGCRLTRMHWGWLLVWPALRAFAWLACWFPWPVYWRGVPWWSSVKANPPDPNGAVEDPDIPQSAR